MYRKISVIFVAMLCLGWLNVVNAKETGFHPAIGEVNMASPGVESAIVVEDGGLELWGSNKGLLVGFPVFADNQVFVSSPVLVDIDEKDAKEIIVVARDANDVYSVFVYDGVGKEIASVVLTNSVVYYDPVKLPKAEGGKDGFLIGTDEGKIFKFTLNNNLLESSLLFSISGPAAVSVSENGDKIFLASPTLKEIGVLTNEAGVWQKSQTIPTDKAVIFPVTDDGLGDIVAVTEDNKLLSINLSTGQLTNNYPVSLPGSPVAAPSLADVDSENPGNEVVTLLSDGTRSVLKMDGGVLPVELIKNSFLEASADVAESSGGLFSAIRGYGATIFSKVKTVLGSVFSRVKLAFKGALSDNMPPVVENVVVNKNEGGLLLTHNLSDADGQPVKPIIDWRKNNTSLAIVNMPFEGNLNSPLIVKDYSMYANNGKVFGGAVWNKTGGHDGFGAYEFDGEDDYIDLENSDSLNVGEGDMTISLWIKTTDTNGLVINKKVVTGGGGQGIGFGYQLLNGWGGTSLFWFQDGSLGSGSQYTYASVDVTDGQWHHVVGVLDRTLATMRVYVDGIDSSKPVRPAPAGSINHNTNLKIGDRTFSGSIDDVVIYNSILSKEEIQLLYKKQTNQIYGLKVKPNENWQACVTPNDSIEDGKTECSSGVIPINNIAPTQDMPQLSLEASGLLVAPQNVQDVDGDAVKKIIDWRKNNTSLAIVNMPFEGNLNSPLIVKDYSMYANNGKVFGGAVWNKTGGHDGFGAYEFDGEDDYIDLENSDSLNVGEGDMTISLWIKTTDTNGLVINKKVVTGGGGQGIGFGYQLSNGWGGTSLFWFQDGSLSSGGQYSYASVDVTDGQWHYVVGVLDRKEENIRVYVDSQDKSMPVRKVSGLGSIANNSKLRIGSIGASYGFNGIVDELQIFNSALSPTQIKLLYDGKVDEIASVELKSGENWQACVTPNDRKVDGEVKCTEVKTID